MGMSTHITGVRNLDGKFAKMIEVKLACEAAGVDYPEQLNQYFSFPEESEKYLRIEKEEIDIESATTKHSEDGSEWWDVDLSKIDPETKKIRFKLSW